MYGDKLGVFVFENHNDVSSALATSKFCEVTCQWDSKY